MEESDISECHQVIEFGNCPYFQTFLAYLEHEGDRMLEVGDQVSMIRSAARINAFKEIRAHLKKQLRDAAEVIERENRNG